MRKLDSDTKRIIELYKDDKVVQIDNLISKRKEQIRNDVDEFVKKQEEEYLFYNQAMENIRKEYKGIIHVNYRFEVSNYGSDFYPLYDEDEILRGLKDELREILDERKNITLALQFADSKSKEYKEALKKLERGY